MGRIQQSIDRWVSSGGLVPFLRHDHSGSPCLDLGYKFIDVLLRKSIVHKFPKKCGPLSAALGLRETSVGSCPDEGIYST